MLVVAIAKGARVCPCKRRLYQFGKHSRRRSSSLRAGRRRNRAERVCFSFPGQFGKHSSSGNILVTPSCLLLPLQSTSLSAFGVSLRRQEEKASGTAKAALQAWYKNHVKPSCGNKKKKALLLLLVKPSRDTQYCHPKKALPEGA